jgi:hypothetical protein
LSFCWCFRQNLFHVLDETHIEHFIRFIQHQRADVLDVERVAFDQVEQATRRADHHIHAAVEARDLRPVGLPA